MTKEFLFQQIQTKKSFLCVGLDTDFHKIPSHLKNLDNPLLAFNKAIIEATEDLCVGYKLNIAFYEAMGLEGWKLLEDTLKLIPKDQFVIADAKRGDIGNTSRMYAKAFFDTLNFDAITVAPYMGIDSVSPFLEFENKWVILLALTSNAGSRDFQFLELNTGEKVYEKVLDVSRGWGSPNNMMYVVGATHPKSLGEIRNIIPDHFLLVPGVGAQGGSLEEVSRYGINKQCGLLVNSSRGIIYAGSDTNFAEKARESAKSLQVKMEAVLKQNQLV